MSSSPAAASGPKICFNTHCKEAIAEGTRRKGWRLRSGEAADLCERCFSTFDQGNFCETFHSEAAGWRKCESCGKRIHCGCIVSIPTYMLLDVGGVECMVCVKKSYSTLSTRLAAIEEEFIWFKAKLWDWQSRLVSDVESLKKKDTTQGLIALNSNSSSRTAPNLYVLGFMLIARLGYLSLQIFEDPTVTILLGDYVEVIKSAIRMSRSLEYKRLQ